MTLATGSGFSNPQLDVEFIYFVAEVDKVRVIARVPKTGGAMTTVVHDVRDEAIELEAGELFFFDAARPQLRAVRSRGGNARVVLEDERLSTGTAIAADATTVYVAVGAGESGAILAVDRR